jgi:hypothetical protein
MTALHFKTRNQKPFLWREKQKRIKRRIWGEKNYNPTGILGITGDPNRGIKGKPFWRGAMMK